MNIVIIPDEIPFEITPITDVTECDIAPTPGTVSIGMNIAIQMKDGKFYVGLYHNVDVFTRTLSCGQVDGIKVDDVVSIREV
jgi:hypothetical protein